MSEETSTRDNARSEDQSYRKAIALDFDGVLHSYTSGWHGIDVVKDEPVPSAIGWLIGMCLYSPYDIIITSVRCNEAKGVEAMHEWLNEHIVRHLKSAAHYQRMEEPDEAIADDHATVLASINYGVTKDPRCFIFIDDRAWKFNGTFPSLAELEHFKPWYK